MCCSGSAFSIELDELDEEEELDEDELDELESSPNAFSALDEDELDELELESSPNAFSVPASFRTMSRKRLRMFFSMCRVLLCFVLRLS